MPGASVARKQHDGTTAEDARRAVGVELGSSNSVKHQIWSSRRESLVEGILRFKIRSQTLSRTGPVVLLKQVNQI